MNRLYLSCYLLIFQLFLPLTASAENISKLVKDPIFGGSVYVQLTGNENKPAVVLIHGLGESASGHWQQTIALLKPNYRVFTLDLPGFGRSDNGNHLYSPENYARLIHHLTQTYIGKQFHLVGHSMGGAIALYYAARYTDDVETLTLIDAAGILHQVAYSKHLAVLLEENETNNFQIYWK